MEQGQPDGVREDRPAAGSRALEPQAAPDVPAPNVPAPDVPASPGLPGPPAPQAAPTLSPPPGWGGSGAASPQPPRRPGERGAVVPLRPLGLGELLDGAVSVVRGYPRPVLGVAAVVAVLGAALELLLTLTLVRPLLQLSAQPAGDDLTAVADELGGAAVGLGGAGLFGVFSGLVLSGLVAPAVSRGTLGQHLRTGELWQQVRPRLRTLLLVCLVVTVAVAGAAGLAVGVSAAAVAAFGPAGALLVVLLVPAGLLLSLDLWVRWAFAPVCCVLEKQGVTASLRRSRLLVRRSWWRVLGVLVLTAVVASVVGQVLQVPFLTLQGNPLDVLTAPTTTTTTLVLASIGGMVASCIVGPFTACVRCLLYVDRRMRAEGLDVALAAATATAARR